MDLLIISQKDTEQWGSYLVGRFQELDLTVKLQNLEEVIASRQSVAHVKLIIVSPDLFTYLTTNPTYTFRQVITDPSKVLLFLCGTKLEDFSVYEVLDRFPYLKDLCSFTHLELDDLLKKTVEYIDNAQEEAKIETVTVPEPLAPVPEEDPAPLVTPRKGSKPENKTSEQSSKTYPGLQFELVPSTVNSEETTEIVVSLNQALGSEAKVVLELYNQLDEWKKMELQHKRLNPYTFQFTAPCRVEGSKIVRLTVDDEVIGTSSLLYQSNARATAELLQFYIHSIDLLCRLCLSCGRVSRADIDKQLNMLFKATGEVNVPTVAYEKLFGMYEYALIEKSSSHLPSMLHLAAHYGLEEFTSQLLDLPGVWDANDICNSEGHFPHDLARINHHSDLSDVLQSSRDIREIVQETYEPMLINYYNTKQTPSLSEQEIYTDANYDPKPPDASKHTVFKGGYVPMNKSSPAVPPRSMSLPTLDPEEDYEVFDPRAPPPHPPIEEDDDLYLPMTGRRQEPPAVLKPASCARPAPPERMRDPFRATAVQPELHPATGGSRKQQELINIMSDVREGTLTQEEAERLFNDWKQRIFDGTKQCSFKEKQARLNEMRNDMSQMKKDIQISMPTAVRHIGIYGESSLKQTTEFDPSQVTEPRQFIQGAVCMAPQPPVRPVIQPDGPPDTPAPQSAVDDDGIYLDLCDSSSNSRYSSASNGSRASRDSQSSGFVDEGDMEEVLRSKSGDKTSRHRFPEQRKSVRMEVLEAQLANKPTVIDIPIPNRGPSPSPHDMPEENAPAPPKPASRKPAPRIKPHATATLPRNQTFSGGRPKPPMKPPRP